MTDLHDKAQESPDVELIRDAQYSGFRLVSTELVGADEITGEDEFPQFGDFAKVELPGTDVEQYVEVPQDLARGLVELGIGEGDEFRIESATKVDGEWQVKVSQGAEKS